MSDKTPTNTTSESPGTGEMARRVHEHDWASSPLGPLTAWPPSLKALVEFMLASPLIASIACGPERLLLYNDAAASLYGDRHPLALGRPLAKSFPDSYPTVATLYDRVFAGESVHVPAQPFDFHGHGKSHVFDAYLTPIRDNTGKVAYAFMMGFDIGERLRAEAERDQESRKRREGEDRLRLALDVAEVGTWTWNMQNDTGYLDARGAAIVGLPAGPLMNVGEAQRATIHPDDQTRIEEEIRTGITANEPFSLNYRTVHANGSVHFVASRAQAFSGTNGIPVQLVGTNRDVTKERLAEITLREAEERQAFLLSLSDALRPLVGSVAVQGEACRLLGEWLGVQRAYYVEIDEASGIARVERDFVRGASPSLVGAHPVASFSWSVNILRRGECHVVADTQTSPLVPDPDRAALAALQIAACMGAPLIKNGRLVGAVCVTHCQPRMWSNFQVELLREVAERIWAAVQQARAETALRESEAWQRALLEGMPQLVWRSHDHGDWTWASPQWLAFTGQSQEDSRGLGWLQAVHPDDQPHAKQAWAEATNKGQLDVEYRVLRIVDGAYVWHRTRSLPVRDEEGQVLEWLGTSTDIEDLKQAEEARREAEEKFRLFVENVQEYALVQTDPEGVIISWNPGAQRLFGHRPEQILGQNFSALLTPEDYREGVFRKELAVVSSGERNEDARWLMRQGGSRFWARWISEPMYDEAGQFRGLAKIMRDETERERVEEFTRQSLTEREELLKEVHHRVKNNLQVIISLLNMQMFQIQDERVLAQFQETRNRVLAISSIHELLYRADLFANVQLSDYARQLVPGLVQFYGLEERVQVNIEGDGVTLELERAVPYGMLLNELVSNACKHAFLAGQTGTITIQIRPEGNLIVLVVADTGPGLPAAFDYRKASSLGLKLVHGLVRQLGGTIDIQSLTGTRITVRFPMTRGQDEG